MYGVRLPVRKPTRPDKVRPYIAAIKTADSMSWRRLWRGLCRFPNSITGNLTSRSLSFQRHPEPKERTSDGQPENLVGRFWLSDTDLNSQKPTLTLALSQRERGLTEVFGRVTPT
jgi:hypothetical protein